MKRIVLQAALLLFLGNQLFPAPKSTENRLIEIISEIRLVRSPELAINQCRDLGLLMIKYHNEFLTTGKKTHTSTSSMTEIIHKEWFANAWVNVGKDEILLDENNLAFQSNNFMWVDNEWIPFSSTFVTYNPQGLPTHFLIKLIDDSGTWNDFAQMFYTYTPDGKPSQILFQISWDGSWLNMFKADFFYNEAGMENEILTQTWDFLASLWVNDSRDSFNYYENGWLFEELTQIWEVSQWINEEFATNYYDFNNSVAEKIKKLWVENIWINYLHFDYSYNPGWIISNELAKEWTGSDWQNFYQLFYNYDDQGRIVEELEQMWAAKGWVNSTMSSYTYGLPIGIQEIAAPAVDIRLSPNPASGVVSINVSGKSSGNISIVSAHGILMHTTVCNGAELTVDIADWPPGLYIVGLYYDNRYFTQRLLKY